MGSVRRRAGEVRVTLEPDEAALLEHLALQVIVLLDDEPEASGSADPLEQMVGMGPEPVAPPDDPALHRLLPDAYRDDGDAASEFRRLTESDLRATKHTALSRVVSDLTAPGAANRGRVRIQLDEEAATSWLHALTDVRLTLGTRIGVTEDMTDERASLPVDSPRYAEIVTYDWLSWLQDAMVRALTGD